MDSNCDNEAKSFALILAPDGKPSEFAFCKKHVSNLTLEYILPNPSRIDVHAMDNSLTVCKLHAVLFEYEPEQCTIVLRSPIDESVFVFPTGYNEASSIYIAAMGTPHVNPTTHELVANLVQSLGGSLVEAVVDRYDAETQTYKCHLLVRISTETVKVDSRISDAIPLSLLRRMPIKVMKGFLGHAAK